MPNRCYVGNLPYTATREDVESFFAPRKLTDVKFIIDRDTSRPKGFCFVELESEQEMRSAISDLDQTEMGGRQIKVSEALERQRGGGGGGGGGGRGDDRGRDNRGGNGGGGNGGNRNGGGGSRNQRGRDGQDGGDYGWQK